MHHKKREIFTPYNASYICLPFTFRCLLFSHSPPHSISCWRIFFTTHALWSCHNKAFVSALRDFALLHIVYRSPHQMSSPGFLHYTTLYQFSAPPPSSTTTTTYSCKYITLLIPPVSTPRGISVFYMVHNQTHTHTVISWVYSPKTFNYLTNTVQINYFKLLLHLIVSSCSFCSCIVIQLTSHMCV